MRNTQLSAALLLFAVAGSAGAHDLFVAFSKPGTAAGEANTALVNNGTFDESAGAVTRARDLVLEFADFTRYSFRRQGEFTTLSEELRSIHSYLELERARFGDRLTVRLRIAPETLATVIPFLSVQPLVENAVRHGLERRERGGVLTVTSIDDGTHTEVIVDDDGVGMDPDELATLLDLDAPSSHVGLRNVDARLRQLYGPGGGLVVETNVGSGTSVRLRVPKSQPQHETARA